MSDSALATSLLAALGIVAVLILGWLLIKWRSKNKGLQPLLNSISLDTLSNFILPDGAGGEIHIDHLLLTPHGLILLETKDIQGTIFAGDRMDMWSATHEGARLTFENPIPHLQERAAAVALLASGTPIEARVLFINEATFPKGHPKLVATVPMFMQEYEAIDSRHESDDYNTPWQAIKAAALFMG